MEPQFEHLFENLYTQNTPEHQYRQPTPTSERDPQSAEYHRAFDRNTFKDWEQDNEPTNIVTPEGEREILQFLDDMSQALQESSAGDNRRLRRLVHAPVINYEGQRLSQLQYIEAKYGHVENMDRKVMDPELNQ